MENLGYKAKIGVFTIIIAAVSFLSFNPDFALRAFYHLIM